MSKPWYLYDKNGVWLEKSNSDEAIAIPTGFCYDDVTSSPVDQPPIDWKETPTAFVFKAEISGIKKGELLLGVQDSYLIIRGERYREEEANGWNTWHCRERVSGLFMRVFKLHEKVKVEDATAKLQDGVLTLTLPKLPRRGDVRVIPISA